MVLRIPQNINWNLDVRHFGNPITSQYSITSPINCISPINHFAYQSFRNIYHSALAPNVNNSRMLPLWVQNNRLLQNKTNYSVLEWWTVLWYRILPVEEKITSLVNLVSEAAKGDSLPETSYVWRGGGKWLMCRVSVVYFYDFYVICYVSINLYRYLVNYRRWQAIQSAFLAYWGMQIRMTLVFIEYHIMMEEFFPININFTRSFFSNSI